MTTRVRRSPDGNKLHLLIALVAFVLGMGFSQCADGSKGGKSRVDWPAAHEKEPGIRK